MAAVPGLSTLKINRVVVHEIPQVRVSDKDDHEPVVSDEPVALSSDVANYIRERVIEAFTSSTFIARPIAPQLGASSGTAQAGDSKQEGHDAEQVGGQDERPESPLPRLVVEYFKDENTLVPMSQEAAHFLYQEQGGKASAGMLLFIDATVGSGKRIGNILVLLKLEKSGALVIDPFTTAEGSQTFNVRLQDIALDKKARVFKVALFRRARSIGDLRPLVSDHQHDERQFGLEVARFFLDFIGCELESTPERDTKAVLERVTDFAESIGNLDDRTRFVVGAMGELASNRSTIDPNEIALGYLPPELRDAFVDQFRIDENNVQTFSKDTRLINSKLGRLVAEFVGEVRVTGPADVISQVLKQDDTGSWAIESPLEYIGPPGRKR